MSKPTCSMPDCDRETSARSYCRLHYTRFMKHGDPTVDLHRVQHTSDGRRVCKRCGEAKPLDDFHKDKGNADGYRAQCKPCRNSFMAGYYDANRDSRKAYEQDRRTNQAEHMRALDMARYERHKEKRIALASEHVKIRRARLAGVETDAKVTVPALRKIHGEACCYCGVQMSFVRRRRGDGIAPNRATLEHVLPISRGGAHTFDNTILACHRCNVSKNNKTAEEWADSRGLLWVSLKQPQAEIA